MRSTSVAGTMPVESTTRSGRSTTLAAGGHVLDLDHGLAVAVELHLGRRAAQELDAGTPRRQVPVLVAHAGRPHLEVADGHLHGGEERLEADRVLEGDHAAEARAVRQALPVAGAGALDHHDFLGRRAAQRRLARPVVEHLGQLELGHDAVVTVAEVADELLGRRLAADGGEDGAGVHRGALGALREVDRLHGALLDAGAAERAGVEVDGAHHAAVVELGEDRLAGAVAGLLGADALAGAAVDAGVGDDVGQAADGDLEVARAAAHRLHRGAAPDVQVGVVDGQVAVEALARAGLGVGGGQALAAVVGREDGADAGGAAAQERPPLDELDAVAHLRELAGGLRAGHAAADHQHAVRRGARAPACRCPAQGSRWWRR